ncbi:class I SAM-dependent methyltransferase [Haloglomus litoreum]|uniref:class I SAM-dependent methyltransferase n=1 Tax=Haloglomus litoreum TaxID=3034026 RepID=UPI0023E8DF2D|nr:class I SAM-dependent methyltransferase [Haloglomus sp. DT116]
MDDTDTFEAAVYDAWVDASDLPWAEDVAFYRRLAREADGPALEVGVGTGRVYLDLRRDGIDVDGIDLSAGRLARLRETADDEGLDVSVRQADVTTFDPDREYGLVYCPARVFNLVTSLADQRAALRTIHGALAPGGRFALNTFAPDPDYVAENYGEARQVPVEVDGTTYTVRDVMELTDAIDRVGTQSREVSDDGGEVVLETETEIALVTKREFELLFADAGFSDWTFYGGFDGDPLASTAQELVAVAER